MSNGDCFWKLSALSDHVLEAELASLVSAERKTTARLVAHLAEVLDRRLHLKQAYASMTAYCREKLGLREDDAGRRIVAARLASRYPAMFPMLASGELSLSVTCKLKHYITQENQQQLLAGLRGRSYREAETWLASKFPRTDIASRIRKLPSPTPASSRQLQSTPTPSTSPPPPSPSLSLSLSPSLSPVPAPSPSPPASALPSPLPLPLPLPHATNPRPRDRGRIEPLSPARYRIEFTAGAELKSKLDLARDLMSHSNPGGDFAPIVERALDLLVAELQRKRFGVTNRPKPARSADRQRISNSVRREVLGRDNLACAYVDRQGKRCNARSFLQHDHKHPRGLGGGSGAANVRLLCAAHNRLEAERIYGRDHIERALAR